MQPLLPVDYIDTKLSNMGGWQDRHRTAIYKPMGFETPIVHLLGSWIEYANVHAARYESSIGDDSVLGPAWAQVGWQSERCSMATVGG